MAVGGGATVVSGDSNPKWKLFSPKPLDFSFLFQIYNPKSQNPYRSSGSEQKLWKEKSLLSLLRLLLSFFLFFFGFFWCVCVSVYASVMLLWEWIDVLLVLSWWKLRKWKWLLVMLLLWCLDFVWC
jgi:hypothetical protein